MKRVFRHFLACSLACLLTGAALPLATIAYAGAEDVPFVDVAPADWFAPYVEVCVGEGLMKGVGNGKFAPGEVLSGYECAVLAMRMHDIQQGGDGSFEPAPKSWGYASLTFPDGQVKEGYLDEGSVWRWVMMHRGDDGHLCFSLRTEEETAWGKAMDYQSAVLTMEGAEYPGTLHLGGANPVYLYFEPGRYEDLRAIQAGRKAPGPQAWWRDAWYYAKQNGLEQLLMAGNDYRRDFAQRMAAVTELPPINNIAGLPDTGDHEVLELYRAGVLTGNDEHGTFDGSSHLTRAEAAAICARILRPELRVTFSPKPLETYADYTLTELGDDLLWPDGAYHLPMVSDDLLTTDCRSLLRLDGVRLPLPEGYEVLMVGSSRASLWKPGEQEYGILDWEGNFREVGRDEAYTYSVDPARFSEKYHEGHLNLLNQQEEQVTPTFSWVGPVNTQGQGFVGLDGKIYRIQLP